MIAAYVQRPIERQSSVSLLMADQNAKRTQLRRRWHNGTRDFPILGRSR